MADITHEFPVVTEDKLKDFYEDIKPFLGCPAYLTSEGNAEYYSTDEKVIGRWIDGKPLYQKVITFTITAPNNWTVYNHGIANIDTACGCECYIVDGKAIYTMGYEGGGNAIAFAGSSNIQISTRGFENKTALIIFKYTKTTDSSATTIQSDPNEYSTDEKIIGKWIDGKPIYQKTLYETVTTTSNTDVDFNISNLFIDTLVNSDVYARYDASGMWEKENIAYMKSNSYFTTRESWSSASASITFSVTLQYTKTTD